MTVALILLLAVTALALVCAKRRSVRFSDADGYICSGAIRNNGVEVSKAVSKASGQLLKACISEDYLKRHYGNCLQLRYNGEVIGEVPIESAEFEINIH